MKEWQFSGDATFKSGCSLYHKKSYIFDQNKSAFVWAYLAPTPCHINSLLGFVDLGS